MDKKTASKANRILLTICNKEFNIGLAVIKLFQYTKQLSIYLQKQNIDLAEAINPITLQHNIIKK